MAWSETLGQVMQTRPILPTEPATWRGGGHRQSLYPGDIPLVIGFVGVMPGAIRSRPFLLIDLCAGPRHRHVIFGSGGRLDGHHVRRRGRLLVFVVAVILMVMGCSCPA